MTDRAARQSRAVAWAAALFVALLAGAAAWWPHPAARGSGPVVVVLDPVSDERRVSAVWPALGRVLADGTGLPASVVVTRSLAEFRGLVAARPDYIVCPDGVALGLDAGRWLPLVAGRRPAPRNLRPRGVLVSRVDKSGEVEPWLTAPGSVIFGDSLSLCATGVLRAVTGGGAPMPAVAWGPDPYDHAPALHALRLGAYDHAVVRQWDAERFLAQGLLDSASWSVQDVTVPVPDLVILVARDLPAAERLARGDRLAGIGRELADRTPAERELAGALPDVGLAGFNLLVEPDFELVRRNFGADWPRSRP